MKHAMVVLASMAVASALAGVDARVPNIFEGSVATNETLAFMGTGDAAQLMYVPDEILSVLGSDLKTVYEKDVDWTFDPATRRIQLTAGTHIPHYTEEEYYPETGRFACNIPGRKYVLFGEGDTMHSRQVCVTYRHSDAWDGPAPRDDSAAFAPFLEELFGFCRGNIVMYGDSITTGSNSSITIGKEPKLASWPQQVFTAITNFTGNCRLGYVNTAVGGMTSTWGVENVQERVIAYNPKLALVAFGMNDGDATANYTNRIAKIARAVHAACPDAAVLLVSPMIPNPEATGFDAKGVLFPEYEAGLAALVADLRAEGFGKIGLANVTTMHGAVLAKKRFRDISGNNINHCNDFSARIYRDTILASLGVYGAGPGAIRRRMASEAWFDGGVAADWPEAASMRGGSWRNAAAGAYADGTVALTNAAEELAFAADGRKPFEACNAVVTARARFVAFTEPPPVPEGAASGIVAVNEGFAVNYYVLAKGANGGRFWRRLPDSAARTDAEVEVSATFGLAGGEAAVEYRIGEYVSPMIAIGSVSDLGDVGFRGAGRLVSLSASVEKSRQGLILIFR